MLKPCPYRKSHQGKLECEIAEIRGKEYTPLTSVDICNECPIPEIIQRVNCKNFIPIKLHLFITTSTFEGDPQQEICDSFWNSNCQKISFENKEDLQEDIHITIPEKRNPRIKARIGALLALVGVIGGTVATTVDFSNNVLELSNKLGFPIEHIQP
ncbi:hypothetical protein [Anabaena sp. PCC 7108]|uniref:hypothetical protein n=1 Tax=Anabaena sp. PCC 7108 TaxID=163908 RepID=UPI000362AB4B|nr:hypothetical protein [Anabaena sp. PCC 7108]